ncbi:O-antigen ligase family protein [Methylobacterium oryzihabitans]|nr:O-antigen ligase family protein [Methylobacterium oryzihabitans]
MDPGPARPAGPLRAVAVGLVAALPAIMAAANRSSPLVIGLAGLLFLAAEWREGGAGALRRTFAPLAGPLGLAALAFLAWCGLSCAWTALPGLSWRTATEFLPALAGAFLVARLAPPWLAAAAGPAGWILAASCAVVVADLAADLAMRRALGLRVAAFAYNRPLLTAMLVVFPLAALLLRRGRRGLAALIVLACLVAAWRSVSGAAVLGLATGLIVYAAARRMPGRPAVALAGAALLAALAVAPVEGEILTRLMPEAAHERLAASSTRARVMIARSFGAAVAADPWRGAGLGTSGRFHETPVAAGLPAEMREMLAVGHPHNSFLQVWVELGLPGAVLAGIALMLLLRALAAWGRPERAAALALLAAAAIVAFVEHGAWAAWWTASLGAAIAWARALRHHDDAREGEPR